MTRYEAYIEKDWSEHGLAHLLVIRVRENGDADYGFFLADIWCLGIKDAFGETEVPETVVREEIEQRLPGTMREPIHPACAKKLIDGALAYAESLGFAPHRDFRKARRVLSGLDASHCPTEFVFGRDGRPCYVQGPNDSDERADRVLAILEARVGPAGFDCELAEDHGGDWLARREDLMAWLDSEPPGVPRFYEVSGMIAALHICPQTVVPTQLLDVLWGPEGRVWADEAEAKNFAILLLEYWTHADELIRDAVALNAPEEQTAIDVWAEDFPADNPVAMLAATADWADGFLRTTELWPDAWDDALVRPDLEPHWEVVRWWAKFADPGNKERIAAAVRATPTRTIARSVVALARALRPPVGGTPEADGPPEE